MGLKNKKILLPAVSTCFSFLNAVKATDNLPVFCDVDLVSGNLDLESVEKTFHEIGFDAILSPNHMGKVLNTKKLEKYNVPIIEDCAQSFLSSTIKKSESTVQVFSFYPTKVANGIDGGAILTDNEALHNKLKDIVNYNNQYVNDGIIRYNCKLSNINATFLLGNLAILDKYKQRNTKKQIQLYKKLNKNRLNILFYPINTFNFRILVSFQNESERDMFLSEFSNLGISREFIYLTDDNITRLNARCLVNKTCSLPLYHDLQDEEISFIIKNNGIVMIIYKATIEDARFLYENLKVLRVGVEYSFEIFSEYYFNYLNNKNNTIYIGRIDNNYIGFITVNIYSSIKYIGYTAELEEVVICEKYRGQGKGKVILQRVIELLGEEKDIRKVLLRLTI